MLELSNMDLYNNYDKNVPKSRTSTLEMNGKIESLIKEMEDINKWKF